MSLTALFIGGCAAWQEAPDRYDHRVETTAQASPDSPAVQAAQARVQASLEQEREGGWLQRLELRLNRIARQLHALDDGLELTARLFFSNPSEDRAEQARHQAETEIAVSALEATLLEDLSERCDRSMEAHAFLQLQAACEQHRRRVQEIKVWVEALAAEGLADELERYETLLEADLELLTSPPEPTWPQPDPEFPLPPLQATSSPLDRDEAVIRALIRQYNPSVQGRSAAAARYGALAERERSREHVHLDFVELGYRPMSDDGWDAFIGQLSVNVPLPGHTSAGFYEHLVDAEHLEATALESELVGVVSLALADISAFEREATGWSQLIARAIEAEAVADRWLEDRRGPPRDILRVARRAFDARVAVIERQRRAGLAACTVLSASGLPMESWPRP